MPFKPHSIVVPIPTPKPKSAAVAPSANIGVTRFALLFSVITRSELVPELRIRFAMFNLTSNNSVFAASCSALTFANNHVSVFASAIVSFGKNIHQWFSIAVSRSIFSVIFCKRLSSAVRLAGNGRNI